MTIHSSDYHDIMQGDGTDLLTADDMVHTVTVRQATFVARYTDVWERFDNLCLQMGETPAHLMTPKSHKSKDSRPKNKPYNQPKRQRQTIQAIPTAQSPQTAQNPHFAKKTTATNTADMQGGAITDFDSDIHASNINHQPSRAERRQYKKSSEHRYPIVSLYRQICQHYALANQRNYSPQLVAQLHARVMMGHRLIYQSKTGYISRSLRFLLVTFPSSVREHYRLFWLAFALFYVPCIVMGVACYLNDELIYSVMSPSQVYMMEEMYNPANAHIGRDSTRASDTDVQMFGHYIYNNISIDFQVYGMGIFFGIGTVFMTLYNGVVIGAVSGHLTQAGFGSTFWSFVAGHGSFELMAIVVAAAAGLRLATPLIAPAPYSRKDAFVLSGKQSITLLLGAAFMTFIAAFIEAFWSSSSVTPNIVKYGVALALWLFVGWYLAFCGRGYVDEDGADEDEHMLISTQGADHAAR